MIAAFAQDHRMSDPTLLIEPVVGLLRKLGNIPLLEKLRRGALCCGFIRDVLGPFFAELEMRAFTVRFGPGATGAVNSLLLIQLQKSARASHDTHLTECVFRRSNCRGHSPGDFADWFDLGPRRFFRRLRLWRCRTRPSN